ncbi:MAG: hydantoinase/oxoprolinase family protein [Candidatus Obscuribacterales bacterium]|nr:hydantoinase/oxoprolinase family protein [Candidatus Obscuribacterales bacterium]
MPGIIRIGIDVGGTFTHAVAIDGLTLSILGKVKVKTTHKAEEGVAKGIIESLNKLLQQANIDPASVGFIAHSTTQATNALLEGDVAEVGVIGMGQGANSWLAKAATNIGKIELAKDKFLTTYHRFIDTSTPPTDAVVKQAINELISQGAKAIAISEAFSVDCPENEKRVLAMAQEMSLPATAGSDISQLYGLKVRTRTAIINASMLPKMMQTADMTESSVRQAGIKAPIMIMRSDGGVMDIEAMRKKPIQTMLSGPAAGVAAAMMYLHISDGIFLEIGGTSTDISAIRNGKALVKSAEVGGHRVYMRTLDVRTIGVAGGSMIRFKNNQITDVGPRSAHIAGLDYVSFANSLTEPRVHQIQPDAKDPNDYLAISDGDTKPAFCLTTTCASNLLNLVPQDDCAFGKPDQIKSAFNVFAKQLGKSAEETAREVLTQASKKVIPVVSQLIKDYKLDPELVTLVGGGGGAAALVPFTAQEMKLRHTLADNADVISAIGVALALVRETVERQIINPSNDDILRVRQEAQSAVEKMGADARSIEVHVEVDSRTNIVRATAYGATSTETSTNGKHSLSDEDKRILAAESMRVQNDAVIVEAKSEKFTAFAAPTINKRLFGLIRTKGNSLRLIDESGTIRLQIKKGIARETTASSAAEVVAQIGEDHANYGDAGKLVPRMLIAAGNKIIDLSGLLNLGQMQALAKIELELLPKDTKVLVIANLD